TEPDLAGYNVYYGTQSQIYTVAENVGLTDTPNSPTYLVTGLAPGTYYFAVTALDTSGNESTFSNEASKTIN
ncbi:MAG: hypothetical protein D6704_02125, partial [Nitrospirae bacterium]